MTRWRKRSSIMSTNSRKAPLEIRYTGPRMRRAFVDTEAPSVPTRSRGECTVGRPERSLLTLSKPGPQEETFANVSRYGLFWGSHVVSWGQSFGQKLLDRAKVFEGHVQRRVNEYLAAVTGLNTLPEEFKIVFRNGAYKIENLVGDHKACIRTAVSRYRAAVKEIRLNSRDKIVEHMSEAYLVARNITGMYTNRYNMALC